MKTPLTDWLKRRKGSARPPRVVVEHWEAGQVLHSDRSQLTPMSREMEQFARELERYRGFWSLMDLAIYPRRGFLLTNRVRKRLEKSIAVHTARSSGCGSATAGDPGTHRLPRP